MKPARVIPARGTATKGRLLATLEQTRLAIEGLPEEACVVLESAQVLQTLRRHVGTGAEFLRHIVEPIVDAVASIGRAVNAVSKLSPPRRR